MASNWNSVQGEVLPKNCQRSKGPRDPYCPNFQDVKTLGKFCLKNAQRTFKEIHLNHSSKSWSSIGIKLKSLYKLQKALNHWISTNQASKASKNFHPKVFKFEESSKNLKNNKFLTSVLPEIHCICEALSIVWYSNLRNFVFTMTLTC